MWMKCVGIPSLPRSLGLRMRRGAVVWGPVRGMETIPGVIIFPQLKLWGRRDEQLLKLIVPLTDYKQSVEQPSF